MPTEILHIDTLYSTSDNLLHCSGKDHLLLKQYMVMKHEKLYRKIEMSCLNGK